MLKIIHRIGIKATPEKIYQTLTTDDGLKSWWTDDVSGAGGVGSLIKFRFGGGGPDFIVSELIENKLVRWKQVESMPDAWNGTEISFDLEEAEKQTFINFSHYNWQKSSDFMAHCSTKWAVFLLSLKGAVESNQGKPFPNDIQIDCS